MSNFMLCTKCKTWKYSSSDHWFHRCNMETMTQFEAVQTVESPALEVQIGGDHYKAMKIQPIEFINKNNLNYCQGNIIKYVTRYKAKNGKQDLEKAKHYIDLLIEMEYGA